MSAGDGYRYLLKSVAAGDGQRSLADPLTRYYAEKGTPPGRWLGSGVTGLADGGLVSGAEVTELQLQLLIGQGRHPLTGAQLGRAYRVFAPVAGQVAARSTAIEAVVSADERSAEAASIGAEESSARGARRAVAGFDFTFSVPKSASVLWAVADAETQAVIVAAHHAAVAEVVGFMEREVVATRVGASDGSGAVAQMDVTGLIATAFDHFDSRAGDPHLHTHVVVSNKARTAIDGQWRALDGRPIHAAVVALSELHEALFADRLTRVFGVQWEPRNQGRDRNPSWAIAGVPDTLIAAFSSRSRHIDDETDRLVEAYRDAQGHRPGRATVVRLRAQATLSTRPAKHVRPLSELTADWRGRTTRLLGVDATDWASSVVTGPAVRTARTADVADDAIAAVADRVVRVVGEKRSTWRRWNLTAEAARQTMGWRFGSSEDREAVMTRVVEAAERASVRLTPPEVASSPSQFRRPDGSSRFRARHSAVYSSEALLEAEDRLLALGGDTSGPRLRPASPRAAERRYTFGYTRPGRRLSPDQAAAVQAIAESGRVVDVLVGPAGAGKTTTMRALRHRWEAQYGRGSVVGLAPSAAAAEVLAGELAIATENTAKWLQDHAAGGSGFRANQLVILDEASLGGSVSLHRISSIAAQANAKVLLVGDWAQLQAVDAGGAFAMLVADRDDPPELVDVHRFVHDWERTASGALRRGGADAVDAYLQHGRIIGGDAQTVTELAYEAWRADVRAGRVSVLIAENGDTVRDLNQRARADRILDRTVHPTSAVGLHDGTEASAGDAVITRRNDRRLGTRRAWVRNGDRWVVTKAGEDGSLDVRRTGSRRGPHVRLPASYVAEHVELGYAITAHRAQGATVDTAHAVITPTSTRESAYVAMTRGRRVNTAYVAIDRPDADHDEQHPDDDPTASAVGVLTAVLAHVGAEQSAHQTLQAEQDAVISIRQLAAEYDTIASAAQRDRWAALIRSTTLTRAQVDAVIDSEAFGPLTAELRRAEAEHHKLETLVPRLTSSRGFDDADDIAAVLLSRLTRATETSGSGYARTHLPPRRIVGLIPVALGPMTQEMGVALTERQVLIEQRARTLAAAAVKADEPWVGDLGPRPREPRATAVWRAQVTTVAAYRDRYGIATTAALGERASDQAQRRDELHAATALAISRRRHETPTTTSVIAASTPVPPPGRSGLRR